MTRESEFLETTQILGWAQDDNAWGECEGEGLATIRQERFHEHFGGDELFPGWRVGKGEF